MGNTYALLEEVNDESVTKHLLSISCMISAAESAVSPQPEEFTIWLKLLRLMRVAKLQGDSWTKKTPPLFETLPLPS